MRKILLGVVLTLVIVYSFKYCEDQRDKEQALIESTTLIQKQLQNVGKLVVTEGYFSEVLTYKTSEAYFGNLLDAKKKAVVIVNAKVTVAYDLSKMKYKIDEQNKILQITHIPEEEISMHPDLQYYDIQTDYFTKFEANDYNAVKQAVNASLKTKIEASTLKTNAKNRLISELSKFYLLTNTMGWTLKYNETSIDTQETFNTINLKL